MKNPKKLLSLALALIMIVSLLPVTALPAQAAGVFAGGSGTPEDPYRIATADQLNTVRYYRDEHFVLTADITLSGQWSPIIGTYTEPFTGSFDGNWHTINNMTITTVNSTNYGLFGRIDGEAEIRNLSLQNVNITAQYQSGSSVGGLVGYATGNATIENCYIQGSVSGVSQSQTGGLVGVVSGATVNQCIVDVDVVSTAGNAGAGGLAGSLSGEEGRITNSYAMGSVSGFWAGGLVGVLSAAASVEYSYATGAVTASNVGGGVVGMNSYGQVNNSYYDRDTTGQNDTASGTPKTTVEMQAGTPFDGWDTNIWKFESGKYPAFYFQCEQHSVTYNLNGGEGTEPNDPNTYLGFESVTVASTEEAIPPTGKLFKEWNTKSDGSGFAYPANGTFGMPGNDITLYAIWDTQYTAEYNLNNGTGTAPSNEQRFAGETYTAADTTGITAPEGKRFLEWNTSADGSGDNYNPGDSATMPAGGMTLYAIWEPSYEFSYDLNAGTGTTPAGGACFENETFTVADDTGITPPDNMQFSEWNTSSVGDGEIYAPGDTVIMPAANLTLYAIWEELQDGSEELPFLVNDYYDLYAIKDGLNFHYRQTANITLPDPYDFEWREFYGEELEHFPSGCNWLPLGLLEDDSAFTGSYDGGGFTISNLVIDADEFQYAGFFGYVDDSAELKNINLSDAQITSSYLPEKGPAYVGALAGFNAGTIQNCTASGGMIGVEVSAVGGICGGNSGTITGCTSNAYLSCGSGSVVGGIAGDNEGTITACTASGGITGGEMSAVGGIVGLNETGTIQNCTANSALSGGPDSYVNGIVGFDEQPGTILNCTDNTSRAQAETLFFNEQEGKFYIGGPEEEPEEVEASSLEGLAYDSDSGVLTLNNFTWVTSAPQALVILPDEDGLTIYLAPESENTLISLFYGRNSGSCGLEVSGSLVIDGAGTLTAQSGTSKSYVEGISVYGDLLINGGTINATADNASGRGSEATGIYADGAITISDGMVNAVAGDAVIYECRSFGINAYEIIISGGTVTATAGTAIDENSYSAGIAGSTITVSGGTVTATGDASALAPEDEGGISVTAVKYSYWTNTEASAAGAVGPVNGSAIPFENAAEPPYKYVKIAPAAETYTVIFDSQGGSDVAPISDITKDATVTLPAAPTKAGYVFAGWNTEADGTGTTFDGTTAVTANVSVYAKWTVNPQFTVTDKNQGTQVGGQMTLSSESARAGDTVIIAVMPKKGYENGTPVVLDKSGSPITVTDEGDGSYSFEMPNGDVTVEAEFTKTDYFDDVSDGDWFGEAAWFCAANGLMAGTGGGQFDSNTVTNRAMLITVLYRLANSSESFENIFSDVEDGQWYSEAIAWAAHNNIVKGYGNGKFGPTDMMTREQMVTILHRYSEFMKLDTSESDDLKGFSDAGNISDWALSSMQWAVGSGIVQGMGGGTISPNSGATRAQFAVMMQRFCTGFDK